MMKIYAHVNSAGVLLRTQAHANPPTGPHSYYEVESHFVWAPPSPTSVPKWVDGAIVWFETADLQSIANAAIGAIDAAGDAARDLVAGNGGRITEYKRAEEQARAYKASGYMALPVPRAVASWASARSATPQWAADDIIAAADRWYDALDDIRDLRLHAKEDIRRAVVDTAEHAVITARKARFDNELRTLMEGLE